MPNADVDSSLKGRQDSQSLGQDRFIAFAFYAAGYFPPGLRFEDFAKEVRCIPSGS